MGELLMMVIVPPAIGLVTYALLLRDASMKIFIIACSAAVIIAILGAVVLASIQEPADKAFSTPAVRLSD